MVSSEEDLKSRCECLVQASVHLSASAPSLLSLSTLHCPLSSSRFIEYSTPAPRFSGQPLMVCGDRPAPHRRPHHGSFDPDRVHKLRKLPGEGNRSTGLSMRSSYLGTSSQLPHHRSRPTTHPHLTQQVPTVSHHAPTKPTSPALDHVLGDPGVRARSREMSLTLLPQLGCAAHVPLFTLCRCVRGRRMSLQCGGRTWLVFPTFYPLTKPHVPSLEPHEPLKSGQPQSGLAPHSSG